MSVKEPITIKNISRDNKITKEIINAERVSGKNNFYVFEKTIKDKYKAYSLTLMPLGVAIIHFKYKKDAMYMAKQLNNSNINFNRKYEELGKDKELRDLMYNIRDEINAGSNFIRAGRIEDFPVNN